MNFIEELKKHNIILDDKMISSFETYYELLVSENEHINLTRITDKDDVYALHFYDSLMASLPMDFNKNIKLLDVGSGPGFPSIPLKILNNNIELHIVEATNKKVNFMKLVSERLNLNNITFNHLRAEDYDKFEYFDYVTTRAVSSLSEQLSYTIPFLKIGGKLISLKGSKAYDELEEAKTVLNHIGASLDEIIPYTVKDRDYYLVVIKKDKKTPKGYPKRISGVK